MQNHTVHRAAVRRRNRGDQIDSALVSVSTGRDVSSASVGAAMPADISKDRTAFSASA